MKIRNLMSCGLVLCALCSPVMGLEAPKENAPSAVQKKPTEINKQSTAPKAVYVAPRAVAVERKLTLVQMAPIKRQELAIDFDRLINAKPVAAMSIEEFREMEKLSQWAVGQRQRLQMINALELRRTEITDGRSAARLSEAARLELAQIEEKLNTIGEDAQLANVDIQNALQKQQQTLHMMSNISKSMHDTAMAIIRKIG